LRELTPQASASANSATRTGGFHAKRKDSNRGHMTAKGLITSHFGEETERVSL
jgi:hypothetical protein